MKGIAFTVCLLLSVLVGYGQNISTNGIALSNAGGGVGNCIPNGYKMVGTAISSASCVSLTQNIFDAGGVWICAPIDLDQSFKVSFIANFDSFNSGDGIAFVLQTEGVPTALGGEGGGMGYSLGNLTGCLPAGDCVIDPSVTVEFDIWNNSVDPWDIANPSLGNINDIACDHASIQTNGVQLSSNALVPPTCLLPGGADVTDGQDHSVCVIWDVVSLEYSVYFDDALVVTYNGDIRANFPTPNAVFWGITAGSGGANQNQQVCSIEMETNISSPTCLCILPVASAIPNPVDICSETSPNILFSSTIPGTTYTWIATDNPSVTGESVTQQSTSGIAESLLNTSTTNQVVNYAVTPTAAGCVGTDLIIPVTVLAPPTITGTFNTCIGSTTLLTGAGTPTTMFPWISSNTGIASIDPFGTVTGVAAGTSDITFTDDQGCTSTVTVTVYSLPLISGNIPLCIGTTHPLTASELPSLVSPWSSSNSGIASISSTGLVTGIAAGTADITYQDIYGCQSTITITVTPDSIPNITTISGGATYCESETVADILLEITGTPDWAISYAIDGVSQIVSGNSSPISLGTDEGEYIVHQVVDGNGCVTTSSLSQVIRIDDCGLLDSINELIFYIPNSFSPNGDENNQTFRPVFTSGFDPFNFNFIIFNRWGQVVWETNDPVLSWDGTFKGKLVQNGTYVWRVEFKTIANGERIFQTGSVNIVY